MFIKLAGLDIRLENPQDNYGIAALAQLINSCLHQLLADPLTLKLGQQIQRHDLAQQFTVVFFPADPAETDDLVRLFCQPDLRAAISLKRFQAALKGAGFQKFGIDQPAYAACQLSA